MSHSGILPSPGPAVEGVIPPPHHRCAPAQLSGPAGPFTRSRPSPGNKKSRSAAADRLFPGGRYWVRTSDLFGVNEALSH
ncbi:hypothetical protein GPN2_12779 [Streptomyces murinus]